MTSTAKKGIAIGAGVLLLAGGAYFLLSNKEAIPVVGSAFEETECPLSGVEPRNEALVDRPAVVVKIENSPAGYPLSGVDEAEVVYEEQVEGGLTRFLTIYHCTDSAQAGPVRSAREVDATLMSPYTRILGASGGNLGVLTNLEESEIVLVDEDSPGDALRRIERPGISSEHTLYGDTKALRRVGQRDFKDPPSSDIFEFGDAPDGGKRAGRIDLNFGASMMAFEWKQGAWFRTDDGEPLIMENGDQLSFDNVIIEEHTVNLSTEFADVLGAPSPVIADITGRGNAYLFRDGRMWAGVWIRDSEEDPTRFETNGGDALVLKPGNTMIELLPNDKGDVKGSFERGR